MSVIKCTDDNSAASVYYHQAENTHGGAHACKLLARANYSYAQTVYNMPVEDVQVTSI